MRPDSVHSGPTLGRVRSVAWLGFALVSCHQREPEGTRVAADPEPARGEMVVVEQSAAQFVAGRVLGRQGDLVRIQTAGDGPSIAARLAEIYRLPGGRHAMHPGDFGICGVGGTRWVGCRVDRVTGSELSLVEADGTTHRLAPAAVVSPNELTTLNLQHHFARGAERRRFLREAEQAGLPRSPPEWRPRPRERILGARGGGWYSARLRELGKERVYVVWQADERVTELSRTEVLPEPPYAFMPHRGEYVLARPSSPAEPWETVRVEAVLSTEHLLVAGIDGERRQVPVSDVVPLG